MIVVVCSKTIYSAKLTGSVIHKVMNRTTDPVIQEKLMQFSQQLNHNSPRFAPFGMFSIDGTLVYGVRVKNKNCDSVTLFQ